MRPTPARGTRFRLRDRTLDPSTGVATFGYDLDGTELEERIGLPMTGRRHEPPPPEVVDLLLDVAHVAIGTSYFKLSAPSELVFDRPVTTDVLALARQTYDEGLREFAVTNGLPVPLATRLVADTRPAPTRREPQDDDRAEPRAPLLPIGGGKDSAAVLGLLPSSTAITITATPAQRRLTAAAGAEHLEVTRTLDPKLAALTAGGGMNGHIPITAVNASLCLLVAALRGHDFVGFGNERSADEPTRVVDGVPVNHQHSKSFAFEIGLGQAIAPTGIACGSVLRRLSGLSVAGLVAQDRRLRTSFLSCNRAFKRNRRPDDPQTWCLECPKCLSTFLTFAPFLSIDEALEIFGGNPLADRTLVAGFAELWDVEAKPFECVAEMAESAVAMAWLGTVAFAATSRSSLRWPTTPWRWPAGSAPPWTICSPPPAPTGCRRRSPIGSTSEPPRCDPDRESTTMRLDELAGKRIVVLGVGIDVAAALPAVAAAGPSELLVVDQDPVQARATLTECGFGGLDVVSTIDDAPPATVALRSPGFSPYQPAVARRIGDGMRTVTPLGLWLAERGDRPALAVTGTKGKSTTSVLAVQALERLGLPAVVLGNIGTPPWNERPDTERVAVLEVSSYQAVDLPLTAPVSALTAVGEDHVGWHGSVRQYLADKARVFGADGIGRAQVVWRPSGLDLPAPFDRIEFTRVPVAAGDLRASNAGLAAAAAIAVAIVGGAGRPDHAELTSALLADYPDLPGRFSTVAVVGAIEFIDDALASNPTGLAAGLRSLADRPVAVIVGGADRGASTGPVEAVVGERRHPTVVVGIDGAGALLDILAAAGAESGPAADLEAAVAIAASCLPGGGVVLFSPGMPTPASQGSWVDRSRRFREAVEHHRAGGAS